MKHFSRILFLAALFIPAYSYAGAVPPPPCPCDTTELSNGLTGNDIIDQVCPNGELGPDSISIIEPETIFVQLQVPPSSQYSVNESNGDSFSCSINSDGPIGIIKKLSEEEFESCAFGLVTRCSLTDPRPIPTLSEWGLIAMAGVLGIIGLVAIRRKRAAV